MRMLVASVQHTARFFKTHPLPVLLQAFIFALQSHKLFSTHSCTFWTACNFKRLVFSFLLSLTPVSDRTCLLPAGVWIVCRSGACHIADYQIIDPVRKVLDVNFPREVRVIYCDSNSWYLPQSIVKQQHTVKVTCVLFL